MIILQHPHDDIFETSAQAIVITVNTLGVMGKGIALEAKRKHHSLYMYYNINFANKPDFVGGSV